MSQGTEFAKDMLQVECHCRQTGYVFVDLKQEYVTTCRKCQKRIYGLNCPKCESGFAVPEDDKLINRQEGTWKCEVCRQVNQLSPEGSFQNARNYLWEEIPKEIKQKNKGVPLWLTLVILAAIYLLVKLVGR